MMNIDLEYYKIFYYVGNLGKISLAAEKLCISQPAVSQAIKLLETQLGTRLFIRTPKGVRLTTEGEVLFSYIKQGYEYILLGEKKFKEMLDLELGEIRIGASDMTLKYYLLPFLEKFHREYPNIKVSVTNAPTPETLQYLESGKIDFGVISEPFEISEDMEVQAVEEIEDIFVVGSHFNSISVKNLISQTWSTCQLSALKIIQVREPM
jgi:DNA-binding transcriptional LysR family regulator